MFGEKKTEWYNGKDIPVIVSEKYKDAKETAVKVIKDYEGVTEGDFWVLKNLTMNKDKMMYSGLIISHNGCLKINDLLPPEKRVVPSCLSVQENGYLGSLVYTYINDAQGVYEVGEVSSANCKIDYPYAMALKRCIDRVVLKNSKIAYGGIYSEVEADEFREPTEEKIAEKEQRKAEEDDLNAEIEKQKREHEANQKMLDAVQDRSALLKEVDNLRKVLKMTKEELAAEFGCSKDTPMERWAFIRDELKRRMA